MTDPVLDLLGWIARQPRTHQETIATWGSHCPRLTPWEDAQESGLVRVGRDGAADGRLVVTLTRRGRAALATRGLTTAPAADRGPRRG